MSAGRVAVLVGVLALLAVGRILYRRWHASAHHETRVTPPLPSAILAGAPKTWVLFTTPWCASCDAVVAELESNDPAARVVKVDATQDPHLAGAYHVKRAPTVLLADARGDVQTRLVGLEAVRGYVRAPSQPTEPA